MFPPTSDSMVNSHILTAMWHHLPFTLKRKFSVHRSIPYTTRTTHASEPLCLRPQQQRRVPTVDAEVIIEHLQQREAVPGVGRLLCEHRVHVHRKQGPENLRVLHQEIAEPCKRLQTPAHRHVQHQDRLARSLSDS